MLGRLKKFGLDGFLLSLIALVALACIAPDLGRTGGWLHIELFTGYGVGLVFLLYGLTLSPERLKAGAMNWRLHVLSQGSTFLLFPLLVLAAGFVAGDALPPDLRLGFFFLAALPSTISSSVAMTSIARGNVAGSIFNASLSSLVGVLVTPLWVNWYLNATGQTMDLGAVFLKIVMLVLLPIVLGQALRPFVHRWVHRHAAALKLLDRATILALVLNSFSDGVAEGVWSGQGEVMLVQVVVVSLLLFAVVFVTLSAACRLFGFSRDDAIAGVFCGTKKSMAAGVPMAKVMFGASPALGIVVAPIILYHFIQLVIASILARRFHDREESWWWA